MWNRILEGEQSVWANGNIRDPLIWGGYLKSEGGKSLNPGVPAGCCRCNLWGKYTDKERANKMIREGLYSAPMHTVQCVFIFYFFLKIEHFDTLTIKFVILKRRV